MRVKVGRFAWALSFVLSSQAFAQVQVNQVFNLQGPSPSIGVRATVQSGDIPPTSGSVAGAVQTAVFDPANGNIYVGTPGGGIWVSTNGGASWTPTSDNKASLAIDSLSLDPTDASGKTLIAGTGVTSNGSIGAVSDSNQIFVGRGGLQNGLLYSQNGGQSWVTLGSSILAGQNVTAAVARGQIMMAGTSAVSVRPQPTHVGCVVSQHQRRNDIQPGLGGGRNRASCRADHVPRRRSQQPEQVLRSRLVTDSDERRIRKHGDLHEHQCGCDLDPSLQCIEQHKL